MLPIGTHFSEVEFRLPQLHAKTDSRFTDGVFRVLAPLTSPALPGALPSAAHEADGGGRCWSLPPIPPSRVCHLLRSLGLPAPSLALPGAQVLRTEFNYMASLTPTQFLAPVCARAAPRSPAPYCEPAAAAACRALRSARCYWCATSSSWQRASTPSCSESRARRRGPLCAW